MDAKNGDLIRAKGAISGRQYHFDSNAYVTVVVPDGAWGGVIRKWDLGGDVPRDSWCVNFFDYGVMAISSADLHVVPEKVCPPPDWSYSREKGWVPPAQPKAESRTK